MAYYDEDGDSVAEAIREVARALRLLGNADAGTQMGGLEALGAVLREGLSEVAGSISDLATAIRDRGWADR